MKGKGIGTKILYLYDEMGFMEHKNWGAYLFSHLERD